MRLFAVVCGRMRRLRLFALVCAKNQYQQRMREFNVPFPPESSSEKNTCARLYTSNLIDSMIVYVRGTCLIHEESFFFN